MSAVKYLRAKEWTMGNGQCHDCCGNAPGKWYPHPCIESPDEEGHQPDCSLAKALIDLGEVVVYAKITDKMKEDAAKESQMKFIIDTALGIEWPDGTLGRKLQESHWKLHGKPCSQ